MPSPRKEWLLYLDKKPMPGSWNMSVDEFLFSRTEGTGRTFLRFYSWVRPTASLGYSQRYDRVVNEKYCRDHGIDIVRRMTGGKLVLHHKEITYSVASSDTSVFTSRLKDSYRKISMGLMRGLDKMGARSYLADSPPKEYVRGSLPCFSYPARDEVEVDGLKVIGSAQKRIGDRFIQHGSIPIDEETDVLKKISLLQKGEDVRMISLSRILGRTVGFEEAADYFCRGLSEFFGVDLVPAVFSGEETEAVTAIEKNKYGTDAWTRHRKACC